MTYQFVANLADCLMEVVEWLLDRDEPTLDVPVLQDAVDSLHGLEQLLRDEAVR